MVGCSSSFYSSFHGKDTYTVHSFGHFMKHTIAAKADDLVFPATHQGDVAVGTASFQHRPALHLTLSLLLTSSNFCPSTLLMFCPLIGNKHGKNEVMK